jgi:hypothetical protein
MPDCATPKIRFETPTALALEAWPRCAGGATTTAPKLRILQTVHRSFKTHSRPDHRRF